MAPLRAALFDLDGTLLDSTQSIRSTINMVLAERGLPTYGRPELDSLIGHPLRDILARKMSKPDTAVVEAMAHRYREAYNESGWFTVSLMPGMEELVAQLRSEGARTAVVTSKGQRETEILLGDLGVLGLFDAVVGDDDVRPLKPDPAPVLAACHQVGCDAETAVMVGDTQFDVLAARAAGAKAVGVLWGHGTRATLQEAGAHAIVDSVPDLRRSMRQLWRD